jgi:hypothetical protein
VEPNVALGELIEVFPRAVIAEASALGHLLEQAVVYLLEQAVERLNEEKKRRREKRVKMASTVYKYDIQVIAEELAEAKYDGKDYYDLTNEQQTAVYEQAMQVWRDQQ